MPAFPGPENLTCQYPIRNFDLFGLDVYLCRQRAQVFKAIIPVDHHWIKTDTKEAGMGGLGGNEAGNEFGDLPFDPVQVVDETGRSEREGVMCELVEDVDEEKVDEALTIGRSLGKWTPANHCQSFTRQVLWEASSEERKQRIIEDAMRTLPTVKGL